MAYTCIITDTWPHTNTGAPPNTNTFKYEINTRRPDETGTPKGGEDTHLNLRKS